MPNDDLFGRKFSPEWEDLFQKWYAGFAGRAHDWHPDPDYLGHLYDWRAAFRAYDPGHQAFRLPPAYVSSNKGSNLPPAYGSLLLDPENKAFLLPDSFRRDPRAIKEFIDLTPYTSGLKQKKKPVYELKPDPEEPAYRNLLGIWRGKNAI